MAKKKVQEQENQVEIVVKEKKQRSGRLIKCLEGKIVKIEDNREGENEL